MRGLYCLKNFLTQDGISMMPIGWVRAFL